MNPELERLEAALRAAHAAGDEAAAQRFAAEIVRLRAAAQQPARLAPPPADPDAGIPDQMHVYYARGGKLYFDPERTQEVPLPDERGHIPAESLPQQTPGQPAASTVAPSPDAERRGGTLYLRATYDASNVASPEETRALLERAVERGQLSPEEAEQEMERIAARQRGAQSVEQSAEGSTTGGAHVPAALQGYGSGMFGVGTPLTALGELISSRFDKEPGASSWGESLEYARGRRDKLAEEHPREFYAGMGSSLVGGIGLVRAGAKAAPRVASVFTPQTGQTKRNLLRLMAAGGAAGGVTAANEQGTEEAPAGATLGAAAGPLAAGAVRVGGSAIRTVSSRLSPDNAAIRLLSKRLGEPVDALQQRYAEFVQTRGRAPRLAEIASPHLAGELGEISRIRPAAGAVFRDAEEQAARALPNEVAPLVRNQGAIASEPAAAARRAATTEEAAGVVGRRVQSTAAAQTARRDVQMDRVMESIGDHEVVATPDMREMLEDPDLMGALEASIRRHVRRAIEAAGEEGSPSLSVRAWDAIRKELGRRAGTESGGRYGQLRNEVRDYVSGAVPEYGAALREFGRRSDVARGTGAGRSVLTARTREFADMLRTAGGGTADAAQRPGTRAAEQVGARVGARTALVEALSGDPAKAERLMERLARDAGMRERVRMALRADEAAALERLAERYGQQLDFSAGLRTGRSALRQNDTDAFREAVTQAGQVERAGVRAGARTALTEVAGESPAGAARTAMRLAEDPGLQNRIAFALSGPEQQRLTRLGTSVRESSRRLAEASPGNISQARAEAQRAAADVQTIIGAGVALSGRASGAMRANILFQIIDKTRIPKTAARKLAEMATDPARAHQVIARLRRAGLDAEEILRIYRDAAMAAGIQTGRE